MKRALIAALLFFVSEITAGAHQLDEYLQGTILSIENDRLHAEMTLTPGVAVAPLLLAVMDADADGTISKAKQRAYALLVLRDLSLTINGDPLTPKLVSVTFPSVEQSRDGRGEIKLLFDADLRTNGRKRQLTLENHHETRISAYQVNCLVPQDPALQIASQERNYTQSSYRLNYFRNDASFDLSSVVLWSGGIGWLAIRVFLAGRRAGLPDRVPK